MAVVVSRSAHPYNELIHKHNGRAKRQQSLMLFRERTSAFGQILLTQVSASERESEMEVARSVLPLAG